MKPRIQRFNAILVVLAIVGAFSVGLGAGHFTNWLTPSSSQPVASADKPVFLRAPYLMQPRINGVVIGWLTPTSVKDGAVRYGTGGRYGQPIPSQSLVQEDGTLQSVKLSGLSPGTSYDYEVTSGGETVRGHFRTLPADGNIRFTAVGDFGGGTAAEAAVVQLMEQQDPDLFVTLGDNTYERGTLAEMDRKVFPQYRGFLSSHGAVWVMGNHDHSTHAGIPTLQNFFMPGRNYSFDVGDVHFTVLEADGSQGYTPGQPYYRFLEQDLAANALAKWKFVFFHYPAYSCGQHGSTSWVDQYWVPLFDKYGVDAVFNGHDHDYERVKPDRAGVHYFVNGLGGRSIDSVRHDCPFQQIATNQFYGDLLVTVSGSTVRVDAVQVGGSVFDSVSWSKA